MDRVESIIFSIRNSHVDIEELYINGQCYNFFLILQSIYPEAEAWYDYVEGHVYSKIGKYWYDIRGKHYKVAESCEPLDHYNLKPHRWGSRDKRRLTCKGDIYEDKH